jgi:hypothetical protein
MPRLNIGKPVKFLIRRAKNQRINTIVPDSECKISKRYFVTYKPLSAFKSSVKYAKYALNFAVVALDCGGNLFWVECVKPACLAKVGALAANLEGEPLVAEVFFLESVVAKLVRRVVLLNDVLNNCASFPERKTSVWVLNG